MKRFVIRNGYVDRKDPVYHRRRRSEVGFLEAYVSDIIHRLLSDQLEAFSYVGVSPWMTNEWGS